MKRFLLATLLCAIAHCAYGADTDGDGLLDLIDVPGFNPNASGIVYFIDRSIQDLDGANLLSNATGLGLGRNEITSIESGDFQGLNNLQVLNLDSNQITTIESGAFQALSILQGLHLYGNRITSLENGDFQGLNNLQVLSLLSNQITTIESGAFQGLSNLQELWLEGNPITSLESGAFQGLSNLQWLDLGGKQITSLKNGVFQGLSSLQWLDLEDNQITSLESGAFRGLNNLYLLNLMGNNIQKLNLTGATFDSLPAQYVDDYWLGRRGFCADSSDITDLILDDAVLSPGSFQGIVGATQFISNASLVGLRFSDASPGDLSNLLTLETLDNVRVDQALFDRYAAEFNAFDAIPSNTVTVVPELPGDYNGDSVVDGADLAVWSSGFGLATGASREVGDADADKDVDGGDFLAWQRNVRPGGALTLSNAAVPEPASVVLLAASAAGLMFTCRTPSPRTSQLRREIRRQ